MSGAPLDPPSFGAAPLSRREALRLLAAALAAGAAGCKPAENIVPLVENRTGLPAGAPLQFATSLPLGGYGRGVLVTSIEGRPTKVSGNPLHPGSGGGATDLFAEAEILGLYDPDRSRTLLRKGSIANWDGLLAELRPRLAALLGRRGDGLAILAGRTTSPTLRRQFDELRTLYPAMRRFCHEPLGDANARAGATLAFGRSLDVLPHLERADVVVCLGADPLGPGPQQLRNAAGFRERRTVRAGTGAMLRLYAVETAASLTGHAADHRLPLSPARILDVAAALAARFGGPPANGRAAGHARLLDALAADLRAAGTKGLVLVGEEQPPELHALGHWLNHALGGFGTVLDLVEPPDADGETIEALAAALRDGQVDTLVVLGSNPAYDAPADLRFAEALGRAPFAVHLGVRNDETGRICRWHVPESHPLEAWSDLRAPDGTAGIAQPLIRPLYDSRSAHELAVALAGDESPDGLALVRATWAPAAPSGEGEAWWTRIVEDGAVPDTAAPAVLPPRTPPLPAIPAMAGDGLALVFRADPTVWDGRYANNAWLQECPKPVTQETWGNALRIAPADAARLGLSADAAVRIEAADGAAVEAPVLIDRSQAEGAVSLGLGYGRTECGAIGVGLGANAYALRRADALWTLSGVRLTVVGTADPIPRTQTELTEDGRDLLPEIRLASLLDGGGRKPEADPPETFYAAQSYEAPYRGPGEDYAWAMVIDTALCIGCNACLLACQAENNVPVVGPDEIRNGRTMHWLRIDAYEKDDGARAAFQPVPCMHCEKAPCEPVCPVGASVHDHEGLNVQVYNRCVGTRFCQANCPYKVRRFNFFGYADGQEYSNLGNPPMQARFNPDVTVRGRGVMEKCTYCVQRIAGARQAAEAEDRRIRDGEVTTACASACPTRAIRFGDLSAADSEVARLRAEPQHYALLEEVGTKPRTTYLARVRNPNPAVGEDKA